MGLKSKMLFYTDTDSLYIEKKQWDVLDKAELFRENINQCKNHSKKGGIFHGLFFALKIKYLLTIDEHGIIGGHKTIQRFTDSHRLLDRNFLLRC